MFGGVILNLQLRFRRTRLKGVLGNDATQQAYEDLQDIRRALPPGYSIDIGGSTEMSVKAIGWLLGPVPVMLVIIISLLMIPTAKYIKNGADPSDRSLGDYWR